MRKHSIALLALSLVVIALVAGACSTTVPASSQIADAEITASVKTRLAADPDVAALNIDVDTNEGVVTLSGRVNSAAESTEAEQVARRTEHVRRVINNLQIGDRS